MHILKNIGRMISNLTKDNKAEYIECKVRYNTIAKIFSVDIDGKCFYPKKQSSLQLKTFKTWKILKLFFGKYGWKAFEETFKVDGFYVECLFGKYAINENDKYKGLLP